MPLLARSFYLVVALTTLLPAGCGLRRQVRQQRAMEKPSSSQAWARAAEYQTLGNSMEAELNSAEAREWKDDCLGSLTLAGQVAAGDRAAWPRLVERSDSLAQALVGWRAYGEGSFEMAQRIRENMGIHALALSPDAPPLTQHIELVVGTLRHCEAQTLDEPGFERLEQNALCPLFRDAPAIAAEVFERHPALPSDQLPDICARRLSGSPGSASAASALRRALRALRAVSPARAPSCLDYYYGLDVPQDFARALSCAREQQDVRLQMLLLLNGQGTTRDLPAARQVALVGAYWGYLLSGTQELERRLAEPQRDFGPLVYCDLAVSNSDANLCAHTDAKLAVRRQRQAALGLRAQLSAAQQLLLDAEEKTFEQLIRAHFELQRSLGWFYAGSSFGVFVGGLREALARQQELRLYAWIAARRFTTIDASEPGRSEQRLSDVTVEWEKEQQQLKVPGSMGRAAALAEVLRAHRRHVTAWARLARSLSPSELPSDETTRAVRCELARDEAQIFDADGPLR